MMSDGQRRMVKAQTRDALIKDSTVGLRGEEKRGGRSEGAGVLYT